MLVDIRAKSMIFRFNFDTEEIEFLYDVILFNSETGKKCPIKGGFDSDGRSVGIFKHFTKSTLAEVWHDIICVIANKTKSYAVRRTGDRDYRDNLRYIGTPEYIVKILYAGVTLKSWQLKYVSRKLK